MNKRFRGLSLGADDRFELEGLLRRSNLPAWQYKRCRALQLLDEGENISGVRRRVGCADHNVRRWVRTYESQGLEAALSRNHGGGWDKKLSSSEEQRLVALACSDAPQGHSRWSIRLLAEHADRVLKGKQVGRETIRLVLKAHDLKPWREKNVVRSQPRRPVR